MMNGYVKIILKSAMALGLFHLAATFFVRSSNLFLLAKTRAVTIAGFLAIPNPATRPSLDSWEAALCGAVFFTLTSGALALCTAHVAPSLYRMGILTRKWALGLHAALLSVFFLLMGIAPETASLRLGAAGVYLVLLPSGSPGPGIRLAPLLFHTLIPVLLALCIAGTHALLPQGIFSGFRDAFLFDNAAGNAVRHFYYTYTLFPAEAFKRLDQISQVTVRMEDSNGPAKTALERLGHIPVAGGLSDYTLTVADDTVTFSKSGTEHAVKANEFDADPFAAFNRFSEKADPFGPLRTLTWYALLSAFPLLFYLLFHATGTILAGILCPIPLAARISTAGVAAAAGFCVLLLTVGLSLPKSTQQALATLSGTKGQHASITEAITRAAGHRSSLVRYRAALAAPRIRQPLLKRDVLTRLSKDRDTNVVCQALGAMGETGDSRYIPLVEEAVRTRPEWYVQWYGYRAMRRLGWQPGPM